MLRQLQSMTLEPNLLAGVPSLFWHIIFLLCIWRALITLRTYRRTGLKSYRWELAGICTIMLALPFLALGGTMLHSTIGLGLMAMAFLSFVIGDMVRVWTEYELSESLRRHGGFLLSLTGKVPEGFEPGLCSLRPTARQGIVLALVLICVTLAIYMLILWARSKEWVGERVVAATAVVACMALVYEISFAVCAVLLGRRGRSRAE